MTRIRLKLSPDGRVCGFEVKEHSGFAPEGEDIVCAAVSFLATTCVNALETVAGVVPTVHQAEGLLEVTLPASNLNPAAKTIFAVFSQGMNDLSQAYPEHVQFVTKHFERRKSSC